jgi:DNA-binding MarR family transcriptional regulator
MVSHTHRVALPSDEAFGEQILDYFYPVHYQLGMELELAMGQGRIGRREAALLWLVHSSTSENGWVSRKTIESQLARWFDLGAPGVSKLVREVSKEDCRLLESVESPHSRRERMLRLTDEGRAFVDGMAFTAKCFIEKRLAHMSDEELRWGLNFFRRAFG